MSSLQSRSYTLGELAQALGVDEREATEILDEHGYTLSGYDDLLTLSQDEYLELVEAPPLDRESEA
jgi:hypothetical protein